MRIRPFPCTLCFISFSFLIHLLSSRFLPSNDQHHLKIVLPAFRILGQTRGMWSSSQEKGSGMRDKRNREMNGLDC
ncbi:hypothetical protein I7I48_05915 [Histoplasma ohiense]|nr:hypothetical protein I7I48_05915 [Histoplasma ohiense (nom. inval.)]